MVKIFFSNLLSSILIIPIIYFVAGLESLQGSFVGRGVLLINLFLFTPTIFIYRLYLSKWYHARAEKFNFLLIGSKDILEEFWKEFSKIEDQILLGKIVFAVPEEEVSKVNFGSCYSWNHLDLLLKQTWSQVVIASNANLPEHISKKLMERRFSGQNMADLTDFYEKFLSKVPLFYLKEHWFISTEGFNLIYSKTNKRIKRGMDLLLSFFIFLPAIPLLIIISLLILLFGGKGPVFYKQRRAGEHGHEFDIYKFRTMVNDADKVGTHYTHKNDPRITRIGKILRKARLDELPQILNVLRGEMNLIGPRPEPISIDLDLREKIPFYTVKHIVKPGITGWTQINCENGSTLENSMERIQFDIYYLKNYSPFMDLRIIVSTIKVVLFGRGSR